MQQDLLLRHHFKQEITKEIFKRPLSMITEKRDHTFWIGNKLQKNIIHFGLEISFQKHNSFSQKYQIYTPEECAKRQLKDTLSFSNNFDKWKDDEGIKR